MLKAFIYNPIYLFAFSNFIVISILIIFNYKPWKIITYGSIIFLSIIPMFIGGRGVYSGEFPFINTENPIIKYSDELLGVIAFIALFALIIIKKRKWKKTYIDKYVLFFIIIVILSGFINNVPIINIGHYLILFLRPIFVFYLIVQSNNTYKELENFIYFILYFSLFEFFISVFMTYNIWSLGKIIVDDPFHGTFAEGGAYRFTFLLQCINIFIFVSWINIKKRKKKYVASYLFVLFFSALIIAGAGLQLVVFVFSLSVLMIAIYSLNLGIKLRIKETVRFLIITIIGIFILTQFIKNYRLGGYLVNKTMNQIETENISNIWKIKIFIDTWDTITKDGFFPNAFFGIGPSNYLTESGKKYMNPIASSYNVLLISREITKSEDPFTNATGLLGSIGILGTISFYGLFFILIVLFRHELQIEINIKKRIGLISGIGLIIFSTSYSFWLNLFDQRFMSLIVWSLLGIVYSYIFHAKDNIGYKYAKKS